MCRICLKRPEIPDERYGRCEACAKAGRIAFRFRLGPARGGTGLTVKAGELSPRALRERWHQALDSYAAQPAARPHLGLHEVELVTARDRLESLRVAQNLASHTTDVLAALRAAAQRTDATW